MMTVREAALALAVITVSAVSASGDDVRLRWKFEQEKVYHYIVVQKMDTGIELANGNISTHMYQRSEITWTVKSVKPDGSAEIWQVFDRIEMMFDGTTGEGGGR
jgi:hypothetical protein